MKLRVRDIISHQGRDWLVEGILRYKIGDRIYPLARVVDGDDVGYVEPLMDAMDDRILFFKEVTDLDTATPPAKTILYQGQSYVPKMSGPANVTVEGKVPDREPGPVEVWRYRAGGDVFLQIEKWPDSVVVLVGESVHKGMIDILPGPRS